MVRWSTYCGVCVLIGTPGFYIGPALQHYRNYRCYISTTKHTRVSNTVMFYHHCCKLSLCTPLDQLTMAIQNLTSALNDSIPPMISVRPNHAIRVIKRILHPDDPTKSRVVQLGTTLTENQPTSNLLHQQNAPCVTAANKPHPTRQNHVCNNGTIIRKKFNNNKWYEGMITGYDNKKKYYKVLYNDGDTEEYTRDERKSLYTHS